jgi:hypothetical protein
MLKLLSKCGSFYPILLEYDITNDFLKEEEFILTAIRSDPTVIENIPKYYQNEKIVLEAVKDYGFAFKSVHSKFRDQREIVLTAVSDSGLMLQYASERLQKDKEIALAAVCQNKDAYEFVDDSLKLDADIYLVFQSMYHLLRPKPNQKIWRFKNIYFTWN